MAVEKHSEQNTGAGWLVTYASLFTTLLAFFVFSMSQVDIETNGVQRDYQRFQMALYQRLLYQQQQQHLDWLTIEMTVTKGIRLTMSSTDKREMFDKASDKISAEWQNNIAQLAILFAQLQLDDPSQSFDTVLRSLKRQHHRIDIEIQVEGHTDHQVMHENARFKDNYELSAARALRVQQLLQQYSSLPMHVFSIAGLGDSRPVAMGDQYAQNRRIEIYLTSHLRASP